MLTSLALEREHAFLVFCESGRGQCFHARQYVAENVVDSLTWDWLVVLFAVFFFPGSVLALGAGVAFGLYVGVLVVWVGAVLGQTLAFIIGR